MGASVVGLFADDGRPFLAVVQRGRLHLVFYRQLLLAHGGQPTLLAFPNNDLPGIYASRAVSRLIRKHGVVPGKRIAVVMPASGFTPDPMANAIARGRAMMPTVRPADRSAIKDACVSVRSASRRRGLNFRCTMAGA